jgi:hypothetical protein
VISPCGCEESERLRQERDDARALLLHWQESAEGTAADAVILEEKLAEALAEIARLIEAGCRPLPFDVAEMALTLAEIRHLLTGYDYVSVGGRDAAVALIDGALQ